jgi:hypothetical protein
LLKANAVVEVYKKILHYDLKQHIDPIQYKISIKSTLAAKKLNRGNIINETP